MILPIAIILLGVLLMIGRVCLGPTTYDRLLATNVAGTKVVLLILLFALLAEDWMYVDVALIYALINFTAMVALLKYFKYGTLHRPEEEGDGLTWH